jgi:ATPase components of ABC transporters with duplicated ATPase domains
MIKAQDFSYSFPQTDLYDKISFTLDDGQHCAFIGASGSGKSTLVEIIMNPGKYTFEGSLEISPNCKIGYLNQFSQLAKTNEITVIEYLEQEFIKLQTEIASICTIMETSSNVEAELERYQQALDTFAAIDGDNFESNIKRKLNLANLGKHKDKRMSGLSGGEFKLIQLIKEMLTSPDLLIMDEPDAFLDFENLRSLKNLINSHKGTMLVITHNRYLLNHCFDKIINLENMKLEEFDGNYIDYNFSLLQRKIELQELAIADAEEIQRNELLIDKLRFIATNNSDAAFGKSLKARVKFQERLEARRNILPFVDIKQPNISLGTDKSIEETVALKVSGYSAKFDDIILENVNFELKSTDKAAIIGANGIGKTTLLRDIFKNNNDSIEIGKGVEVAYLSQYQGETLSETNTILEEFFDAGFNTRDEIISFISDYGFDPKVVDQKIKTLSGGERNILQLAKISAGSANLLLIDEPTSHLDIYSQSALEKAIKSYNGAILMISHDFYTIVNCVDYVLLIEDKRIRKMSMRKFRKTIYASYFDRDYLELEQKKMLVETKIAMALKDSDFALAKVLSEELEKLIGAMNF